MGREIRRVPPNWLHPTYDENNARSQRDIGKFIPMFDQTFEDAVAEWKKGFLAWEAKKHECYIPEMEYWEWDSPPNRECYRPRFTQPATWYQIYETVSEGTPCSPPLKTKDELVNYLMTEGGLDRDEYPDLFPLLTREQAERFVKAESCFSMVFENGELKQGIQSL